MAIGYSLKKYKVTFNHIPTGEFFTGSSVGKNEVERIKEIYKKCSDSAWCMVTLVSNSGNTTMVINKDILQDCIMFVEEDV